jgi:probable DNA metabolism protein
MVLIVYDGSFEGFFSAVFDIYDHRFSDVDFTTDQNYQQNIFDNIHKVITAEIKTRRVQEGLKKHVSGHALSHLYKTLLSEIKGIENTMLSYIRYALSGKPAVEYDYSNQAVLKVRQTSKIVDREKHRMEAFIRFQLTGDGLYYAVVEPDFDVLPLIQKHFYDRYADQYWMIYDIRRKYGLYYDKKKVVTMTMTFGEETSGGKNIRGLYDENEELYQRLWKKYFDNVNIQSRRNMKLHIQHVPKRYWKFLTEKL